MTSTKRRSDEEQMITKQNAAYENNIREDTQEMQLSRSKSLPRHQKKERLGTNKDKTNTISEKYKWIPRNEIRNK